MKQFDNENYMTDNKKPLLGLSLHELKEVAKSLGMPLSLADRWQSGCTHSTWSLSTK